MQTCFSKQSCLRNLKTLHHAAANNWEGLMEKFWIIFKIKFCYTVFFLFVCFFSFCIVWQHVLWIPPFTVSLYLSIPQLFYSHTTTHFTNSSTTTNFPITLSCHMRHNQPDLPCCNLAVRGNVSPPPWLSLSKWITFVSLQVSLKWNLFCYSEVSDKIEWLKYAVRKGKLSFTSAWLLNNLLISHAHTKISATSC